MSETRPDLRATQRYSLRLAAEVVTPAASVEGVTRDISAGGVCVELDRLLVEGEIVELKLFIVEDDIESTDGRVLSFAARVQWATEGDRSYAHGLKFEAPPADKVQMLENALRVIAASQ